MLRTKYYIQTTTLPVYILCVHCTYNIVQLNNWVMSNMKFIRNTFKTIWVYKKIASFFPLAFNIFSFPCLCTRHVWGDLFRFIILVFWIINSNESIMEKELNRTEVPFYIILHIIAWKRVITRIRLHNVIIVVK